ncbi:CocE/NonD family hydrolase [Paucibacter sp. B2R-40]|uniref:alpha/beta hydrolase family protein n=1 Tax=Paucibacter sp. B2R-40 TaxID=2893554 RepID=UPI0021E3D3D0|nr:alpha/beta hydrolase [Paucibacter sp. B2R-40]MCV2353265.1 CocE/NonD family hydrolase [Paucibacter sp. B2R-40]
MLSFLTAALLAAATVTTAATAAVAPLDALPQTRLDAELRCLLGVYALPAGRSVTITGFGGQPRGLQYSLSNGQFGNLQEAEDGTFGAAGLQIKFEPCSVGTMTLAMKQGQLAEQALRLPLLEKETSFFSDGVKLHGKLVLPPGGRAQSLAVWVEGSNNDPSTDDSVWQYELARRGIAVFVYDKRGTGASAGAPLSDFHARARDTAAAVQAARRLAPDIRSVGVIGASQGGWVAPLTATLVELDFVIAAFAMAEGPIAQDRALVEQQVREASFDAAVLAEAKALTVITENIVRSNLRDGFAALDAFKANHAGAPWLEAIQPRSYTGIFLKFSSEDIKTKGPALAQGLSFDYEPRPVIEAVKSRQLWLLGGSDRQAPNASTQAILRQIQLQRPNIAVVLFPRADHGLIEPIQTADGVAMAYSAKLFDVAADWIKGQKLPAAGMFIEMPAGGNRGP